MFKIIIIHVFVTKFDEGLYLCLLCQLVVFKITSHAM